MSLTEWSQIDLVAEPDEVTSEFPFDSLTVESIRNSLRTLKQSYNIGDLDELTLSEELGKLLKKLQDEGLALLYRICREQDNIFFFHLLSEFVPHYLNSHFSNLTYDKNKNVFVVTCHDGYTYRFPFDTLAPLNLGEKRYVYRERSRGSVAAVERLVKKASGQIAAINLKEMPGFEVAEIDAGLLEMIILYELFALVDI